MRLLSPKVYDPFVSFLGVVLFAAAVLVTAVASAAPAATDEDAGAFLISFGKRAADEINNESLSETDREQRFRELFNEVIDVPAMPGHKADYDGNGLHNTQAVVAANTCVAVADAASCRRRSCVGVVARQRYTL